MLLKPFGENLGIFAAQYLCIALVDLIGHIFFQSSVFTGISRVFLAVSPAYAVTFVYGLFRPGKAKKAVGAAICLLGAANVIFDIFCLKILGGIFSYDCVQSMVCSTVTETTGFLGMYVDIRAISVTALALLVIWSCFRAVSKVDTSRMRPGLKLILTILTVTSTALWALLPEKNHEGIYADKLLMVLSYEPVDLGTEDGRTYDVTIEGELPECVVLIIGESHAKSHVSTYGYRRDTAPRLDSMARKGDVIPFFYASTVWPRTIESLLCMMTNSSFDPLNGFQFRDTFLTDVMKSAGYKTFWLSNHNSFGFQDNPVTKIAEKSDSTYWVPPASPFRMSYDERLLPPVKSLADSQPGNMFLVIHPLGQHEAFKDRYPEAFGRFKPDRPSEKSSAVTAEYDNSILYNDFIVSEMMKTFADREAVVVYVPDHGMDIYASHPHYAGHARPHDPVSLEEGLQIPMYVFVSDKFRKRFPLKCEMMESMASEEFVTDRIMEFILEISGITYRVGDFKSSGL